MTLNQCLTFRSCDNAIAFASGRAWGDRYDVESNIHAKLFS